MPWNTEVLKKMRVYVATNAMRKGEQSLAKVIKVRRSDLDFVTLRRRGPRVT